MSSFPGYQVAGFEFEYSTFFLALLFGLFAEIFALGVKLKRGTGSNGLKEGRIWIGL